jgi:hypothetical protein
MLEATPVLACLESHNQAGKKCADFQKITAKVCKNACFWGSGWLKSNLVTLIPVKRGVIDVEVVELI